MFERFIKPTLPVYLVIGVLLVILCALIFPGRLGSLLGFINRQFIATLFVFVLYEITSLDPETKPYVLGAALIAGGMAV